MLSEDTKEDPKGDNVSNDVFDDEHAPDTIFEETDVKEGLAEINFDLVDTGRWLLKVVGGPNNGAEFSMQPGNTYVIGTDPNSCDIVFHDTSVSRQHARITIGNDDKLTIEDLKSRNGTHIDGELLKGKRTLGLNALVAIGTTNFIVYDREGEMQTIISPLMPSIVKVLQKEEPKKEEVRHIPAAQTAEPPPAAPPPPPASHIQKVPEKSHTISGFIIIGIITGLFVIAGIGTMTLFRNNPVTVGQAHDATKLLQEALAPFPSVKYSYTPSTGQLLLVGHVLTSTDKNQLTYNLQGLNFIKNIDDTGVVIDEYVWRETNQLLNKNPIWRGVTIHSPTPGKFILSGYLQTRKQGEQLSNYMTTNFPYLDLLEQKVVVEEDTINSISNLLQAIGIRDVAVQMSNGEVTLSGGLPADKQKDFDGVLGEIKAMPGVRLVKNLVTGLAPEQSMINISDKYEVSGFSRQGTNINVVINGRILSKNDELDGMQIKEIKSNVIYLEKDGVQYRIDFSR